MRAAALAAFGLLLAHGSLASGASELLDATGTRVVVPEHVSRIVTLAPSLGELVADLDTEHLDRIVGVSEYTDYPPSLKSVQTIGPYHRFSLEKVAALKPDLVLATKDGNAEDQIKHLRELGLCVVVVDSSSFTWIEKSMRLTSQAIGVAPAGERLAHAFAEGTARAKKRAEGRAPKRVLLQLGEDPLIVAGGENFLSEALSLIGAKNVYGDSRGRYPRPSLESALSRNPDTIVVLALGDEKGVFEKMVSHWSQFPALGAVKSRSVKLLRADPLLRPTLRLFEGLRALEKAIYGTE